MFVSKLCPGCIAIALGFSVIPASGILTRNSAAEPTGTDVKQAVEKHELAEKAAVDKIAPAVVIILGTKENHADKVAHVQSGLGVIVDPKGIVVIPRRLADGVSAIEVVLSDGRKLTPKTVVSDPKANMAILKLEGDKPFPHAELGDSDKVKVGDWALSLDLIFRNESSIERGIISRKRRATEKEEELLDMDSARSYPSTRDLLFNMKGKLIGVWTKTGAIPSNKVKEALTRSSKKE